MKNKVIKVILIILFIFCFFTNISKHVKALETSEYCTKEAALQLAMIARVEAGGIPLEDDPNDYMFLRLTATSVVLNNAIASGTGNTMAEKIYNLPNWMYDAHSTYRDGEYASLVQGEFLYYAELVLTGKYNVPKNIYGQASCRCAGLVGCPTESDQNIQDCNEVSPPGNNEWAHVKLNGALDAYFSYYGSQSLSDKDVFGHKALTIAEYKNLANSYKLNDYSAYTTDTVCGGLSEKIIGDPNYGGSSGGGSGDNDNHNKCHNISVDVNTCENPDILKPIYFGKLIFEILSIAIPIILIIIGMVSFSKSVVASDAEVQKRNVILLIKKIISAILIFAVPWIVGVVMVSLGDLAEDINFTDCLENANKEKIEELEENYNLKLEEYKEENDCD